jgi:hypothetical protein
MHLLDLSIGKGREGLEGEERCSNSELRYHNYHMEK